ncbi:hypothetical protein BGZ49_004837, partial [Haplosporangium sp. Z 27]
MEGIECEIATDLLNDDNGHRLEINYSPQWLEDTPSDLPSNHKLLEDRLQRAFTQLQSPPFNENMLQALKALARFGLVIERAALAESSVPLACYLVEKLFNFSYSQGIPCKHNFSLNLVSAESFASSIEIPARSRILFLFLSRKLKINIFLFSSRAKARCFRVEDAKYSIGVFHNIDSYRSISEYLVIAASRYSSGDGIALVPPPPADCDSDLPEDCDDDQPAAKFRNSKGKYKRAREDNDDDISPEQAVRYLKRACVEASYTKFANTTKLKKGQAKEQFLEEKRLKMKSDFEAKSRLPQGIMQDAIKVIKKDFGKDDNFESYYLNKKVAAYEENPTSNIDIWKGVVRDNFEVAWRTAEKNEAKPAKAVKGKSRVENGNDDGDDGDDGTGDDDDDDDDGNDGNDDDDDEDDENDDEDDENDGEDEALSGSKEIRTCTVPLKRILRSDVATNHYDDFLSIAQDRQIVITNIMSEVSLLSLKAVQMVASGALYEYGADEEMVPTFSIKDILPQDFTFRDNSVGPSLQIAPLPLGLQKEIEEK